MDDKLERTAEKFDGDFSLDHIHYDSKSNTVHAYLIRPIKYIEVDIKLSDCINYD